MQNVLRLRKRSSYHSEMDVRIETKCYIKTFELWFFMMFVKLTKYKQAI